MSHTDQDFIRSFWEWFDRTHILVSGIKPGSQLIPPFPVLVSRMSRVVLVSLLAACVFSFPHKQHPLELGFDIRGHKHHHWVPQWQKKQLIFKGKPAQPKDVKVCKFKGNWACLKLKAFLIQLSLYFFSPQFDDEEAHTSSLTSQV